MPPPPPPSSSCFVALQMVITVKEMPSSNNGLLLHLLSRERSNFNIGPMKTKRRRSHVIDNFEILIYSTTIKTSSNLLGIYSIAISTMTMNYAVGKFHLESSKRNIYIEWYK